MTVLLMKLIFAVQNAAFLVEFRRTLIPLSTLIAEAGVRAGHNDRFFRTTVLELRQHPVIATWIESLVSQQLAADSQHGALKGALPRATDAFQEKVRSALYAAVRVLSTERVEAIHPRTSMSFRTFSWPMNAADRLDVLTRELLEESIHVERRAGHALDWLDGLGSITVMDDAPTPDTLIPDSLFNQAVRAAHRAGFLETWDALNPSHIMDLASVVDTFNSVQAIELRTALQGSASLRQVRAYHLPDSDTVVGQEHAWHHPSYSGEFAGSMYLPWNSSTDVVSV